MNYFNEGDRFGVRISYVQDDSSLKGTAGSVLNAYRKGAVNEKNTLLVYYGDILTNLNVKKLVQQHQDRRAFVTVALAKGFTVKVGLADLDEEGKILGFVEKPKVDKPVSIGILVFDGETLQFIEKLRKIKKKLDLMRDVIPHLIGLDKSVYGYISDDFWYDVGSTEAYEKLNQKLVNESFSYLFNDLEI
jgi:mannose-1-phosphate guanylyltransferase